MKFNNKISSRIVEMVEQDYFGIAGICKIVGIAPKTFYEWKRKKPDFSEAVDEAFNRREEELVSYARMGLKQLLEGYVQKEEKITYVPQKNNPAVDIEKCRVVKKKHCPPNLQAIRYVLDRNDREKTTVDKRPQLIIEVQDEETKRQLEIFRDVTMQPDFHPKWDRKAALAEMEKLENAEAHHSELEADKADKPEAKPAAPEVKQLSEKLRRAMQPVDILPPGYKWWGERK
jgi:transposase-like protein